MFTTKNIYPALIVLAFMSCSRSNNPPSTGKDCKIITETINDGTNINKYAYEYNSDGKLSRSIHAGASNETVTYSYSGNKIFRATGEDANALYDTITVNEAGFILHDKRVQANVDLYVDCVYDANGQLMSYSSYHDPAAPMTSTFVFTNGDNTFSLGFDGSTDSLDYDLSKPAVNGNTSELYRLQNGAYTIKNKHLLISDKSRNNNGNTTTTYSYQYDGDGNISTITIKGNNSTSTISFTYSCQ